MKLEADGTIEVDGQTFRLMSNSEQPGELALMKPLAEVEAYRRLIADEQPKRIVELGIFGGGSVAWLAMTARPGRLVALDLRPGCPPLDRLIEERGLPVVTHYGTDQGDAAALDRIMAENFDGPVDLIVDDASHLDEPTRVSFDRLFPHLRPGGLYVIEDWGWKLQGMVSDLLAVAARRKHGLIDEMVVDAFSVRIRRGRVGLRPGEFWGRTTGGSPGRSG